MICTRVELFDILSFTSHSKVGVCPYNSFLLILWAGRPQMSNVSFTYNISQDLISFLILRLWPRFWENPHFAFVTDSSYKEGRIFNFIFWLLLSLGMKELTLIYQHTCKSLQALLLEKYISNNWTVHLSFIIFWIWLLTEITGDKKTTIFQSSICVIMMKEPSEYGRIHFIS